MFKKAVNGYDAAAATAAPTTTTNHRALKQQLFPSSSPTAHDASNNPKPALHVTPATVLNSGTASKPLGANTGTKRTSDGLAKAIGEDGQSGFADECSQVILDENDFDSDVDLDFSGSTSVPRPSVTYPALPPSQPPSRRISYPSLQKAKLHTESATDFGYNAKPEVRNALPPSSVPIPWSSSPIERKEVLPYTRPCPAYDYDATKNGDKAPSQQLNQHSSPLRQAKRRTLPWLDQPDQTSQVDSRPVYQTGPSNSKSRPTSVMATPATSKAPDSSPSYPWNTTASAIKEQQKQLRKANKPLKANDILDAVTNPKTAKKKAERVLAPLLTAEQRRVLNLVVDGGKSVFFTGSAGTGKSVLLREIIAVLRKKYQREPDRVAITASTGLAACNVGGVTLHSFGGIGLGKEDVPELVKKIKRNQKAKHRWMRTKVLVIDEVSMVDAGLFDKLQEIAQKLRNNTRPFGGIQLVITGDFFQLPPVPDYGDRVTRFAFDAQSWTSIIDHTIGLHHVFRQKDPKFANMLNEMREGHLSPETISTFRGLARPLSNDDDIIPTELFPTRAEVDRANKERMERLGGDVKVFQAKDAGTQPDKAIRDKLLQNCMAPDVLELKKGAQVMLIKNIDETLVNGSLGKVVGFMNEATFDKYTANEEDYTAAQGGDEDLNPVQMKLKRELAMVASTGQVWPLVRFTLADGTSRDLLCNREPWKVEQPNGEVLASRHQVPLILAYALSIHKAQGQTMEKVKVDLGKVFEKGQAYVALSRATSMAGLQVLRFDPKKVLAHERVRSFYAGLTRAEHAGADNDEYD